MKLEFLPNVNNNYPEDDLIRLFDIDINEVKQINQIIKEKIFKRREIVDLSSIPFIKSINCNLILTLSNTDAAIQKLNKNN